MVLSSNTKLGVYSPIVVSFQFTNLQLPIVRPLKPPAEGTVAVNLADPCGPSLAENCYLVALLGGSREDVIESSDEMRLGGSSQLL